MLLTFDVGNTHIKVAVYHREQLAGSWRATTDRERTADEWVIHLDGLLGTENLHRGGITGCIISSVVPPLTETLDRMVRRYLDLAPLVVSSRLDLGITIDYPRPGEIGADRLVSAAAAHELYGAPVIVVDFGTATKFNVVDGRGAFIGGIIAPGLEVALSGLAQRAAKLFTVEMTFPPAVIGKSTTEAIQSGLMWGAVDLVEGLGRRVLQELGQSCPLIATGGLAPRVAEKCESITTVDPHLTTRGLQLIWERNR